MTQRVKRRRDRGTYRQREIQRDIETLRQNEGDKGGKKERDLKRYTKKDGQKDT